jgi:hypothetical protein
MIRVLWGLPFSYRQRKLARGRDRIDKLEFIRRILAGGGDEQAGALLWDVLVSDWVVEGFTPYPEDSLGGVYGLAEEDLDEDLILRILREERIPVPGRHFVQSFGVIDSPLRLAQFVSECRKRGSTHTGPAER